MAAFVLPVPSGSLAGVGLFAAITAVGPGVGDLPARLAASLWSIWASTISRKSGVGVGSGPDAPITPQAEIPKNSATFRKKSNAEFGFLVFTDKSPANS